MQISEIFDVAVPSQFAFIASQISSPPCLPCQSFMAREERRGLWWPNAIRLFSPSLHRHRGFGRLERFRQSYYRASRSLVLWTNIYCRLCCKPLSPEASLHPFSPPCSFFLPSNHLVATGERAGGGEIIISDFPSLYGDVMAGGRRPHHLRKRSLSGPKWTPAA